MDFLDNILNFFRSPQQDVEPEPLFTLAIREKTFVDSIKKEPDFSNLHQFIPDEVELDDLNYKEFTQMFATSCANAMERAEVQVAAEGIVLVTLESGGTFTSNLANTWIDCSHSPGSRKEQIAFHLASMVNFSGFPDTVDLNKVIPVIRDFDYPLNLDSEKHETAVGASVASGLDIVMAIDLDFGVQIVSVSQLEASGISLDKMMELAIQNLIEKALPPKVNVYQGRDCNWVITSDESTLNSSIILVDDVMNFMQKEAGGKLAFAVPSRDMLLCNRSDSEFELKRMSKFLLKSKSQLSHFISANIYSYDKGEIKVLVNNNSK